MRRIRRSHRCDRDQRRGAALVIVTIFGLGALMLVSTLLALTDSGTRFSAENQRHRRLTAVLKVGIADALNEINRDAVEGNYDPNGDGVGAIVREGTTGTAGVPVRVTTATGVTEVIGYYRATVRHDAGRDILTVVAAWPSFAETNPERRLLAAAELEVTPGDMIVDQRPIQIDGSAASVQYDVDAANHLHVDGVDDHSSDQATVPAANVSDDAMRDRFTLDGDGDAEGGSEDAENDSFVEGADTFVGQDPNNPGGTATGSDTVTQQTPKTINQETLEAARAYYSQVVADALANPLTTVLTAGAHGDTSLSENKTYVVPGGLTVEGTFTGTGTLIVQNQLQIDHGNDLIWNGDLIIAGYHTVTYTIDGAAQFQLKNGSTITVNGNLIMLGENTQLQAQSGNAGGSTVNGALLMLTEPRKDAQLQVDGGTDFLVNGIMAIYGEQIQWQNKNGAKFTAAAMNLVMDSTDASSNALQVQFDSGAHTKLLYDNAAVKAAVQGIKVALGSSVQSTKVVHSYWEGAGGPALLDIQEAVLAQPGPWGHEDDVTLP